jgi:ribonuclease P/MRP protein subunit POP1
VSAGILDRRQVATESGLPAYPWDYPDTPTGAAMTAASAAAAQALWQRTPPAKRTNHAALGVSNPFAPDWASLVPATVCVRGVLAQQLAAAPVAAAGRTPALRHVVDASGRPVAASVVHAAMGPPSAMSGLVPVRVRMAVRGLPAENAALLCPLPSDVARYEDVASAWLGADPREEKQDTAATERTVVGYITSGGFSFVRAKGAGFGYISAQHYAMLPRPQRKHTSAMMLLVRNPNGGLLRPALVTLALD